MTVRTTALAVLSGLLLAASFPTINLHFLAWIGLVPLLLALNGCTTRQAFWLGGFTGLFFFAGTVYWVTNSVHFYGNVPLIPASFITLLLSAYLALYPALFAAAVVHVKRLRPSLLFIAVPALWTALELARTYVFSGFPWSLLGYSQYRSLPIIQVADIAGVYGVSFLIVLVNEAIAETIADRKKLLPIITAAVLVILTIAYGFVQLGKPEGSGGLTVSVIQGNIDQDKKWDASYQYQTIAIYEKLTLQALQHHPDLVIWPETAAPFYFTGSNPTDRRLNSELVKFVAINKTPLLFGSPTYEIKSPKSVVLHNSAFLLGDSGAILAQYNKFHLVPFGEYVPLKSVFFFIEKMVQAIGDFESGNDYTVMTVPSAELSSRGLTVSTVICYEIIFPDLVRKFVDKGATIVTTITNDAWFGKSAAPYQHFSMAVFRAVENRVPIARAANTGVSGFIDAKGNILATSDIFVQAQLTHRLTPGTRKTFYTRYGDLFSYCCLLFSFAVLIKTSKKAAK